MIFDTHCHIISEDQRNYPRDTGPHPADWIRDLTADEFLSLMSDSGVERAVLVQAFGAYRYDNRYVADSAARYPRRFVSVCIIDPLKPSAPEKLDYCVNQQGIRGLRVVTWTEPPTLLDDPRIIPLWRRAADLRIPVCVLTTFDQVPRLRPVLERFPDLRLALDHLGLPSLSRGPAHSMAGPLFELARFPNFYGKFSSWTIESLAKNGDKACTDFFRRLIDGFGPERLMWGSNFPASNELTYRGFADLAQERLGFLSADERRWLFSDTALSLWPMLR
jgi:predicted TIM-barrel fold metal-dependent hydrolase